MYYSKLYSDQLIYHMNVRCGILDYSLQLCSAVLAGFKVHPWGPKADVRMATTVLYRQQTDFGMFVGDQ